jgi:hypothetical protein
MLALTKARLARKGKALTVFFRQREKLRGNTVPPALRVNPWLPPQL